MVTYLKQVLKRHKLPRLVEEANYMNCLENLYER